MIYFWLPEANHKRCVAQLVPTTDVVALILCQLNQKRIKNRSMAEGRRVHRDGKCVCLQIPSGVGSVGFQFCARICW